MFRSLSLFAIVLSTACGSATSPKELETARSTEQRAQEAAPPPAAGEAMAAPAQPPALPEGSNPALLDATLASETAPDAYKVKLETTKGDVVIEVKREWAPKGADRFYNLVKIGYFDGVSFFRAIDGFMVQFGIHGNPRVNQAWNGARIDDDPVKESNKRGMVTFAMAGPNTRTTQLFINYTDRNSRLDTMGFAPFGKVVEGMQVVDAFYKGYGECAPRGNGPDQGKLQGLGQQYLDAQFPRLDHITKATLVTE